VVIIRNQDLHIGADPHGNPNRTSWMISETPMMEDNRALSDRLYVAEQSGAE
jgi:hypothetical protein